MEDQITLFLVYYVHICLNKKKSIKHKKYYIFFLLDVCEINTIKYLLRVNYIIFEYYYVKIF